MLAEFFQLGPILPNQLIGTYDLRLVLLSYIVAVMASYIALDITGRLHDLDNTKLSSSLWLLGGAFAMGAGIWSMHFIGMLAFKLPMNMSYDLGITFLSMLVAVAASAFALVLLKDRTIKITNFVIGGVILGLAIASMHYIGMAAMNMTIHYIPSIFILSILIAILASEAALALALKSNQGSLKMRIRLKIASAIIMGAAICGMHYTGMMAAVFTHTTSGINDFTSLNPQLIAIMIAVVAFFILGIAFAASLYKEIHNHQIVKLAHESGMAEVATNVLHNIGNVLNNINMSASLIEKSIKNSELSGLIELDELMNKHKHDLNDFVTTESGSHLPDYINILANCWKSDNAMISDELQKLLGSIEHIKMIISMQQTLSVAPVFEEIVSPKEILEEALLIANINTNKTHIQIEKQYEKISSIVVNKVRLMQILINLIRNAKQSLNETNTEQKKLLLKMQNKNNKLLIQIIDNGVGIPHENLTKIFRHGFTTKKEGHGFGLHASAIAAKEMNGSLDVESQGIGKGATFSLVLPYKVASRLDLSPVKQEAFEEELNDVE